MDFDEGRIFFILQRDACGAVRFVTNDKIKFALKFFLRLGNHCNGLIRGKNDEQVILMKFFR